MTDSDGFEDAIRDGLRDSTAHVVAHDDLQDRLITSAASGRPAGASRAGYFRSTWALPVAAAVITALAVGSVVLVSRNGDNPDVVSGTGATLPAVTSSAPVAPVSRAVGSTAASSSATHTRQSSSPTTSTAHTSAATTSERPPSSSPDPTPSGHGVPATCTTPAGGTANPTTLAEFTRRVTGTWLVCSSPSIFGTSDAGLQITPDGHWAKLVRDPSGRLVQGSGLHDSGTWKALDDSAMNGHPAFQLNLMSGNQTVILLADFAAAVDRVQFDNNGVYDADYVPTSERVG